MRRYIENLKLFSLFFLDHYIHAIGNCRFVVVGSSMHLEDDDDDGGAARCVEDARANDDDDDGWIYHI